MTQPHSKQRGIALIAVLWLVSAMSLITAGIVQSVRSEIQTVSLQKQAVTAGAQADAAILLALQSLQNRQKEVASAAQTIPVTFEGVSYQVLVQPLNGRIDLNKASQSLLAALYQHAGGIPPNEAQTLAQTTISVRQQKNAKGTARGFDATEDLLSVPGVDYGLYARLVHLVCAELKDGSGRVNPSAAPAGVLLVLSGGNAPRTADLVAKRDATPLAMDTSFFNPEYIDSVSTKTLNIQVSVRLADEVSVQRAWHVHWDVDPRSGLPWRVLSTHQSFQHKNPAEQTLTH